MKLEKKTETNPNTITSRFYIKLSDHTKSLVATVTQHKMCRDDYNFHGTTSLEIIEAVIAQMKGANHAKKPK